jgi:hypothetical protein
MRYPSNEYCGNGPAPTVVDEKGERAMTTYAPDECDVSVVLPIYNEKGHLRAEIDRIRAALEASRYSFELIVVDDGSNDGSESELSRIEGITLITRARVRHAARAPPRHAAAWSCGPTST